VKITPYTGLEASEKIVKITPILKTLNKPLGSLKDFKHVGLKVKTESGKNIIVEGTILKSNNATTQVSDY
jgi:hypothetical protein